MLPIDWSKVATDLFFAVEAEEVKESISIIQILIL